MLLRGTHEERDTVQIAETEVELSSLVHEALDSIPYAVQHEAVWRTLTSFECRQGVKESGGFSPCRSITMVQLERRWA